MGRAIRISDAARIFRVMNGTPIGNDMDQTTVEEVRTYINPGTFETFLKVNRLNTFEEVLR